MTSGTKNSCIERVHDRDCTITCTIMCTIMCTIVMDILPVSGPPKRLTAEKLYLIQPSTSSSDGILWCEIVVSSFFSEYFFEGLKPEDYPNEEIILEMPTDDFHRALKIDRPDKTIPTTLKLKLSREDFAAGQKRAHETTVGESKQPVIVIQLNLQQASTGRDLRTIHKAFARTKMSIPTKAKY